jgi:hypothetical protein
MGQKMDFCLLQVNITKSTMSFAKCGEPFHINEALTYIDKILKHIKRPIESDFRLSLDF